jgi:putative thioredoxin
METRMQQSIDVNLENFQQVMLTESKEKVVMVEFWAEGYAPSAEMAPVLAKLASHYADSLLHARVDCQTQPEIAQQFGVRGLPTVILVKDGQPIEGFAGPQEEVQIKGLLEKHLPKEEDAWFEQAQELANQGDYPQAYTLVKQAYDNDPKRAEFSLLLADCQIELGQIKAAKTLLASIGLVDQGALYKSLLGKIELAEQAAESPEILALQQQLTEQPDNLDLKVKLAIQLHQANQIEEALALMLSVLIKELAFGEAKKLMLDMINALPDGDPLKSQYRRKVYALLY